MLRRFFRNLALYLFHLGFVFPLLWWFVGVRYRRRDLVPRGPCLVVANHNSHLDAAVLMWLFPLRRLARVHPVAAADYFGSTWLRRTMAMLFMNAIAIERRPKLGRDVLAPVVDAIEAGESVILFPEGSRGEAGVVAPFRPGVGRLVRSLPGLLVVPVFMSGPERIWPRGKVVPVPLATDVNVGKPRSYPADLDPREIAERVRNDVLALAPPPPPVPGPRPGPPVRIAVCGIDDEARRPVIRSLTERMGRRKRTLGITTPMLEADGEGLRELPRPVPLTRSPAWLGLLAGVFRTGGRFKGAKFAETVELAAIDEALEDGRAARYVVGGGSPLVELLAWVVAEFHKGVFDERDLARLMQHLARERKIRLRRWWNYIRHIPEVWLLNVFDLARMLPPDVVVLLATPPGQAMRRLRSEGRALLEYENEEFLGELQQAYRHVAGVLDSRRRTLVLEFDTETTGPEEIAARVEAAMEGLGGETGKAAPA